MATTTTVNTGPDRINLTGIRAGDRNEMIVEITADGVPLDLSGSEVRAQARLKPTSSRAIEAVITEVDATKGQYVLGWDGEQVRMLMGDKDRWQGVWDLEVVEEGQSVPRTLAAGTFTAVMDVTRS